jgi:hypothetical protein
MSEPIDPEVDSAGTRLSVPSDATSLAAAEPAQEFSFVELDECSHSTNLDARHLRVLPPNVLPGSIQGNIFDAVLIQRVKKWTIAITADLR